MLFLKYLLGSLLFCESKRWQILFSSVTHMGIYKSLNLKNQPLENVYIYLFCPGFGQYKTLTWNPLVATLFGLIVMFSKK